MRLLRAFLPRDKSQQEGLLQPGDDLRRVIDVKQPIHQARWKCLTRPDVAAVTTSSVGTLRIKIVKARALISQLSTRYDKTFGDIPDPFVKVLLNDVEICETAHLKDTERPVWNQEIVTDIAVPTRGRPSDAALPDRIERHCGVRGFGRGVFSQVIRFRCFARSINRG